MTIKGEVKLEMGENGVVEGVKCRKRRQNKMLKKLNETMRKDIAKYFFLFYFYL